MIDFIKNNWVDISSAINALIAFATVVVGMTKTDVDNKVLAFIVKLLNCFSVLNPKDHRAAIDKADKK